MGQDLKGRAPDTATQRPEPWLAVLGNTVRLWLERHHVLKRGPAGRRRRLVIVLSAVVAMAFGAGITLAFTGPGQQASPRTRPSDAAQSMTPLQLATYNRLNAAKWIKAEVSAGVDVSCDLIMCQEAEQEGYPPGQLMVLPSTAPDPLGAELIIATPAIRSQFGSRLGSVYAPQVIARFGSGAQEVDVRYLVPGGTAAFDAGLSTDLKDRVNGGEQLLTNSHIQASPAAKAELRAGQVDPRLLITLAILAPKVSMQLIAFDASSPGESSAVDPLRGAEIGAGSQAALSEILSFLAQQTGIYAPAYKDEHKLGNGKSVITVRYGAPGPLDVGGS